VAYFQKLLPSLMVNPNANLRVELPPPVSLLHVYASVKRGVFLINRDYFTAMKSSPFSSFREVLNNIFRRDVFRLGIENWMRVRVSA
jgi:hypothetical protein